MSGQGRGGGLAGVAAEWQGGGKKGRGGGTERSLCLSPSWGIVSLLTGVMLNGVEGRGRPWFCNKIACSTACSHLTKTTTGETQTPSGVP